MFFFVFFVFFCFFNFTSSFLDAFYSFSGLIALATVSGTVLRWRVLLQAHPAAQGRRRVGGELGLTSVGVRSGEAGGSVK